MIEITQNLVREFLNYDPKTGVFTWRNRSVSWFKTEHSCNSWNGKHDGKVAGSLDAKGYIFIGIFGRLYRAHRLAWLYEYGAFPSGTIDHINGIKDDNRIDNMRDVTQAENCRNHPMRRDNTSGFKGVIWHKQACKWEARVKTRYLGLFDTAEEAHAAYVKAATGIGFSDRHIHSSEAARLAYHFSHAAE